MTKERHANWTRVEHEKMTHKDRNEVCPVDEGTSISCNLCDLFWCKKCGAVEGTLTTDCPGVFVGIEIQDRVFAGELDFVAGEWLEGKVKEEE